MASQHKQAKQKFTSGRFNLNRYFTFHWQALLLSIRQLRQTTLVTYMTMGVIGISLALPTVFFVLLKNAHLVTEGLEKGTQISLFLNATDSKALPIDRLIAKIDVLPDVARVRYISPEEGLQELEKQDGLSGVLKQLPSNPLPPVVEVYPAENISSSEQIEHLLNVLKVMPGVESVKLDMLWVKRLQAILALGESGVWALSVLLAVAVVLVINHTIRLATQTRQKEMNVLRLIGATLGFARRPFLYTGILYGLAGGLFAWIFVEVFVLCLSFPAENLAELYHTHANLQGLTFMEGLSILLFGTLLGWFGSWLAVNRCIKAN